MRFKKRPVIIDAVQFTGENDAEVLEFLVKYKVPFEVVADHELVIHTLEGDMHVSRHDWIIKDVQGEFYPCKPDIFSATYERSYE